MSITAAKLQVEVGADTSRAEAKLNSFSRALSGFTTGMLMGAGMAAANAIGNAMRGAVVGMDNAVTAASNLGETVSMMNVVMGASAAATLQWSTSAATALGMSQNQALNAAATFATFGKSAGLAGQELTKFATGFVGLAADLASFRNTSPEEAIVAIGAALRGESEPIRRYGVLLDDATLRQAAFNLGITDSIKNVLTPQQRVLAATAEMWRQTADAQGDVERTGGALAGQQRQLTANMENLSATMGQAFLPVVLQTTTALNTGLGVALPYLASTMNNVLVPALNTGITGLTNFIGAQMGISTAFDGSEESVRTFTTVFAESINNQIQGFNAAILATVSWQTASTNALAQVGWEWNEFTIKFAVQINRIVGGLNTAIEGMNTIGKFGNPNNPAIPSIPSMGVPFSQVMPRPLGAPGAADVFQIPALKIDWDAKVTQPATIAADKAGDAIADTVTGFSGAAGSAMDDLAGKLKGALNSVPGLMGISTVTGSDMDKAAAGMSVNFADDFRRHAMDELLNGVDWAEVDPAKVAQSIGLDPSLPAKIIADELNRQWETGEYFANTDNLTNINWAAVQAKLDQDAKAALGQSNIFAAALAQGITLDSMTPVAAALSAGAAGAVAASDIGAATGLATTVSINTPEAIVQFQNAGESAFGSWRAGWEFAASGWVPPAPNVPPAPIIDGTTDATIKGANGQLFGLTIDPALIGPKLPTNAVGTSFWRGGPTWVGERGPEIVSLPRGSQILNNQQSMAVLRSHETREPAIVINATIGNDMDLERLAWRLEQVRKRKTR